MSKDSIAEWDVVPSNNTDVGGIGIIGSSAVSNFDDALRTIMAQIKSGYTAADVVAKIGTLKPQARAAIGVYLSSVFTASNDGASSVALGTANSFILSTDFIATSPNVLINAALTFDGGNVGIYCYSFIEIYKISDGSIVFTSTERVITNDGRAYGTALNINAAYNALVPGTSYRVWIRGRLNTAPASPIYPRSMSISGLNV